MRATIRLCVIAAAKAFNVTESGVVGKRRNADLFSARFAAMYLAEHATGASLPEIGRHIGGRDHTTVIHGLRRAEDLGRTSQEFSDGVSRAWLILAKLIQISESGVAVEKVRQQDAQPHILEHH